MRALPPSVIPTALLIVFVTLPPSPAFGQTAWAIDPSVRAAGMGQVSVGVFWEPATASWQNPALLGYLQGVHYASGEVERDRFGDTRFAWERFLVGGYGVGLLLNGWPLDNLGEHTYDVESETPILNEQGEPIGSLHYYDHQTVGSVGIGVNTFEFLSHALPPLSVPLRKLAGFLDVSAGLIVNDTEGISGLEQEEWKVEAETQDYGVLARLTPVNSIDSPATLPRVGDLLQPLFGGIRIDATYGYSHQNYREATVPGPLTDSRIRLSEYIRRGGAVRLSSGLPQSLRGWLNSQGLGFLAESLTPLISWGIGWDHDESILYVLEEKHTTFKGSGWELTIANIFSMRRGRIDDPSGTMSGSTSGWGLGFALSDIGGCRYDEGTVPNTFLGDRTRTGFALYLHPIGIWKKLQGVRQI